MFLSQNANNTMKHILSKENTLCAQGMSALAIMIMHFVMQIDGYPRFLNILGGEGVAVFLFVSGFGLNESYKKTGLDGYIKKRFLRVIIPCWIVFAFRLPYLDTFSIESFLKNLTFIDSELWFVDYIIQLYIVYWLARKLFSKYTTHILFFFGAICIFREQLVCEQAFSFFAGYLASEHYDKVRTLSKKSIFNITAFSFLYATVFILIKEIPYVRQFICTLPFNLLLLNIRMPLAIVVITLPYLLPWIKKAGFFGYFGKISYELYIVHFNFMPCIASVASVLKFSAMSTVIGDVFAGFNAKLRENGRTINGIAAVLFITICYTLNCKYSMRVTEQFGYEAIPYAMLLAVAFVHIGIVDRCIKRRKKLLFFTLLAVMACAMLAVQSYFDPLENNVDRWSAIDYPLTYLFDGEFPYNAPTHLGGNASPFPMWMVFHIPFWFLGNVGLSEIVTSALFACSIVLLYGYKAGIKAIIFILLSVNVWYEVAVRSDMISNFFLLGAFLNYMLWSGKTLEKHPCFVAVVSGLWLSTRISTFFPLFIMFFPSWLQSGMKTKIKVPIIALLVFCATFLPLVVWDSNSLFFAVNNPFSLQTRQGHPGDVVLLLALAVYLAVTWKGNAKRLMLHSALMLLAVVAVAWGHNMFVTDGWTLIFTGYDLTYWDAALPMLMTILCGHERKVECSENR